jgi:uncharacterized membrane protein
MIMSRGIMVITATILSIYGFCVLPSFAQSKMEVQTSHERSDEPPAAVGIPRLIGWLGKFHPAVVHFPIALLIAAAAAEVLFIGTSSSALLRRGQTLFENARQYCLWFGIIGAIGAGTLGWFFAGFELVDKNWLLTTHRWLGTSTVICSLLLGWLAWRGAKYGRSQLWFRLVLLLAVILVSATGFFGGAMLYGLDQYAW